MTYIETTKGRTLHKFFVLIPLVVALILHNGRNQAVRDVSTISALKRSSNLENEYPFNTTTHKDSAQTAWCVLDKRNIGKNFYHFPHTLQVMSQCWSFLMMERRKYDVKFCGLYFNVVESRRDFKFKKISPWARELISAMNCTKIIRSHRDGAKPPETDDFFNMLPRNRWFEEVEDLAPLQEAVLRKRKEGFATREELANHTFSIGLIQRYPSRKECERKKPPKKCAHYREFINLEQIQKALAENFPGAKIRNTKLKRMNLADQASWWWHRDVVIAAHGASMSNVMFMRPGTAVIEVFPTYYEPMMFQELMNDVGVYGYPILNATYKDVTGYKNRDVPLAPSVDEVIRLVKQAIQRRKDAGM